MQSQMENITQGLDRGDSPKEAIRRFLGTAASASSLSARPSGRSKSIHEEFREMSPRTKSAKLGTDYRNAAPEQKARIRESLKIHKLNKSFKKLTDEQKRLRNQIIKDVIYGRAPVPRGMRGGARKTRKNSSRKSKK